ncbi:hemolymph lipopolysaccharide-binding protein [Anabrus simplex]|uniref:hemolymph lipopolysaccharide-binding protein n=1 Tax=Anabrus simplex TaxID=316456 RepID=UPI0035A2FF6D
MVKLWIAVLVIGMIISLSLSTTQRPVRDGGQGITEAHTVKIDTDRHTPTTRPPPVINNCTFYYRDGYRLPYLRFHIMKQTWAQAKSTCEREGGHLASPRTGQELEIYMDHVSRLRQTDTWYWIGVSRDSVSKPWMTAQGDELIDEKLTDDTWSLPGNPLVEIGCWMIYAGNINYTDCLTEISFLCERELC